MSERRSVDDVIKPALDEYDAEMGRHGHDLDSPLDANACLCGFEGKGRTGGAQRRSVGLHISAANKRADKAYDQHVDRLLAQAREEGWR